MTSSKHGSIRASRICGAEKEMPHYKRVDESSSRFRHPSYRHEEPPSPTTCLRCSLVVHASLARCRPPRTGPRRHLRKRALSSSRLKIPLDRRRPSPRVRFAHRPATWNLPCRRRSSWPAKDSRPHRRQRRRFSRSSDVHAGIVSGHLNRRSARLRGASSPAPDLRRRNIAGRLETPVGRSDGVQYRRRN